MGKTLPLSFCINIPLLRATGNAEGLPQLFIKPWPGVNIDHVAGLFMYTPKEELSHVQRVKHH